MSFTLDCPFLVAACPSNCMYMDMGTDNLRILPARQGNWKVEARHKGLMLQDVCAYVDESRREELLNGTDFDVNSQVECCKGMYGFFSLSAFGNNACVKDWPKWQTHCSGPTSEFYAAILALLEDQDWGRFPFGVVCNSPYGRGSTAKLYVLREQGEAVAVRVNLLEVEEEALNDEESDFEIQ